MSTPLFHLFILLFRRHLVEEAYRGILQRDPDSVGLAGYGGVLSDSRDLAGMLRELATSPEFWERTFAQHASELVRSVFLALLGREPEPQALAIHGASLARSNDLAKILTEIAEGREHWERAFSRHAPELVRAAFLGLLGREPEPETAATYSASLTRPDDLANMLADIAHSSEHWDKAVAQHAPELVRIAFLALLDREPESQALAIRSAGVTRSDDLAKMLAEIVQGPEYWEKSFTRHAPELVRIAFLGLLGREPEPEVVASYGASLARPSDLAKMLADIAAGPEHWERGIARHAPELIRIAFLALLDREPEPDAVSTYSTDLARPDGLRKMLADIAHSSEHWYRAVAQHAPELVRAAFLGLLGREPEPEAIKTYAATMTKPGGLSVVLAGICRSEEFVRVQKKIWPQLHPAATYETPTPVFLHLQKTAGTSLQKMLLDAYAGHAIYHEHSDTLYQFSPSELSRYAAFLGHFNHDSFAYIPRKSLSVFTFVRKPKERLVSLYYFWRAHEPNHFSYHPGMQAANELPIDKFLVDSRVEKELIWNHQTWGVMGHRQWQAWRTLLESSSGDQSTEFISRTVRPAIAKRLGEFVFVGLQDEFDESVRRLFDLLERPAPEVKYANTLEGNMGALPNFKRKIEKQPMTPAIDNALDRLVQLDNVLYEEAQRLFRTRYGVKKSRVPAYDA